VSDPAIAVFERLMLQEPVPPGAVVTAQGEILNELDGERPVPP
jgi:hypothetical protein